MINSLKCAYRLLVDKPLLDTWLEQSKEVYLFQVLDMLSASRKVTPKQITENCFCKADLQVALVAAVCPEADVDRR